MLKNIYSNSQPLSREAFEKMCQGGKILEGDPQNIKVIRLVNGQMLKVFRVKRVFSGANLYSYARRFWRNALRLSAKEIPTVANKALYHFDDHKTSAVLYQPLPGETLRDCLVKGEELPATLATALGVFIANLHQKGVHFHSLHTGNIVLTPEKQWGLIDVSDLSMFPWSLFCNTRVRSFKRLCRYPEELKQMGKENIKRLLDGYYKEANIKHKCRRKIENQMYRSLGALD